MKTNLNNKTTKKAPTLNRKPARPAHDYTLNVTRAFDGQYGILFDLEINDVTLYGLRVCATQNGQRFIGFPQKKDKNGKYWNVCYAPLSDEQTDEILNQISAILEGDDEE